eukprot:40382-Pleurochrysis_carterae.AAC.1
MRVRWHKDLYALYACPVRAHGHASAHRVRAHTRTHARAHPRTRAEPHTHTCAVGPKCGPIDGLCASACVACVPVCKCLHLRMPM